MSSLNPPPNLAEFLAVPAETVAAVAPPTAIYAPGGTRRRARMEGGQIDETYVEQGRLELVANFALFFRLGIRHLVVPSLGPHQLQEVGNQYGARILDWIRRATCSPEMIAVYQQRGWRGRMIIPSPLAEIRAAAADLQAATPHGEATVWYYLVADDADPWTNLLTLAAQTGARTREEAIRILYGEDIPPATLFVGFGKPVTGSTLIPPLLTGPDLHCYWTQRAGLRLTDDMLRRILYDYAYARRTWRPDRTDRYAHAQLAHWDTTGIIGVGSQIDGFWYPDPFPSTDPNGAADSVGA